MGIQYRGIVRVVSHYYCAGYYYKNYSTPAENTAVHEYLLVTDLGSAKNSFWRYQHDFSAAGTWYGRTRVRPYCKLPGFGKRHKCSSQRIIYYMEPYYAER